MGPVVKRRENSLILANKIMEKQEFFWEKFGKKYFQEITM